MISVQVLGFDPSNAGAPDSSNIGAYLRDKTGNLLTSTSFNAGANQALDVNVLGSNIDVGVADKTAYTYGTSVFQPVGGVFQNTSPTLSAGESGAFRLSAYRSVYMSLMKASDGTAIGESQGGGLNVIIGDGTNVPHVTPASTAAVAADKALVVAINPLSNGVSFSSPTTAAMTTVVSSTSSQTLVAANASRKGLVVHNATNRSIYVAFDATATTSAYTYLVQSGNTLELGINMAWTGLMSVIGAAGISGNILVTDLS